MKTLLPFFFCLLTLTLSAQITTPVIRAGFGVDADLRSNFFNGFVQSGNDDWFTNGHSGTGHFVIDTTGAAAIRSGYATDVSPFPRRMATMYRTMSRPAFSVVNNRLWLDALFIRDYHGNDSTVFIAGSDKNGMSPGNWSGGIQGIPDKNDILDMFMHVRRAGPSSSDSLWFFGGLSLDNVTGNRYFDFEMYQTDIYFDRASARWYGFGPDAGHTSWEFDEDGKVTRPGDIIFSAEYQSASLTNIEARIWVHKSALTTTPAAFDWSGQFDGAGSGALFGYASILPKNGGTFYTGLQCGSSEWAGPFQLVLQNNSVVNSYSARQFMEFSVNLTKLGLDPVTIFGTDICGTPFNRIVVKTRASASFTAELKDFVAPIDLFLAPRVDAQAEVPIYCGVITASTINVRNPSAASAYSWSTPNGNIFGSTTGSSITVTSPGTYIVEQRLAAGCDVYASDTVIITFDASCTPLESRFVMFKGLLQQGRPALHWTINGTNTAGFEVERSFDGRAFETVASLAAYTNTRTVNDYSWSGESVGDRRIIYYRLRMRLQSGKAVYSQVVALSMNPETTDMLVFPIPASHQVQIVMAKQFRGSAAISVANAVGNQVYQTKTMIRKDEPITLDVSSWMPGVYYLQVETDHTTIRRRLVITRNVGGPR